MPREGRHRSFPEAEYGIDLIDQVLVDILFYGDD